METPTSQPTVYSQQELSALFRNSLSKFVPDESVREYLLRVLLKYVQVRDDPDTRIPAMRCKTTEQAMEEACMIRLHKANMQPPYQAYHNLRGLGDMLMFVCGFMPEYFAYQDVYGRKPFRLEFYVENGSEAYQRLATLLKPFAKSADVLMLTNRANRNEKSADEIVDMLDADLYAYLGKYFVGGMNALMSARADAAPSFRSIDKKVNDAVTSATLSTTISDGIPRNPELPCRDKSGRGEPVILIGGKEYPLSRFYLDKNKTN